MKIEPSDELRRRLASMPDAAPPSALWPRLEASRRRQLRQRRNGAVAAGSILVLACASTMPWTLPTGPGAGPSTARVVAVARSPHDVAADLRAIDHALQVAYSRGASDDELTPLWNARRQMLARVSTTKI